MNPIVTFVLAIADVAATRFGHQANDVVEILKFGAGMLDAADDIPPEFEELVAEVKAMADTGGGLSVARINEFREMRKALSGGISGLREALEEGLAAVDAADTAEALQAIIDDDSLDGRVRKAAQDKLDDQPAEE